MGRESAFETRKGCSPSCLPSSGTASLLTCSKFCRDGRGRSAGFLQSVHRSRPEEMTTIARPNELCSASSALKVEHLCSALKPPRRRSGRSLPPSSRSIRPMEMFDRDSACARLYRRLSVSLSAHRPIHARPRLVGTHPRLWYSTFGACDTHSANRFVAHRQMGDPC